MTVLEKFIKQIVLKQIQGSVYLVPAICDFQIEEALKEEKESLNALDNIREDIISIRDELLLALDKEDLLYAKMQVNNLDTIIYYLNLKDVGNLKNDNDE